MRTVIGVLIALFLVLFIGDLILSDGLSISSPTKPEVTTVSVSTRLTDVGSDLLRADTYGYIVELENPHDKPVNLDLHVNLLDESGYIIRGDLGVNRTLSPGVNTFRGQILVAREDPKPASTEVVLRHIRFN
jgi:hypothetical protein